MPTNEQTERATQTAERLESGRYVSDGDYYAKEDVNGTLTRLDLNENQKMFVLTGTVDFGGFSRDQELDFIQAVVEDADPATLPGDTGEAVEPFDASKELERVLYDATHPRLDAGALARDA